MKTTQAMNMLESRTNLLDSALFFPAISLLIIEYKPEAIKPPNIVTNQALSIVFGA